MCHFLKESFKLIPVSDMEHTLQFLSTNLSGATANLKNNNTFSNFLSLITNGTKMDDRKINKLLYKLSMTRISCCF